LTIGLWGLANTRLTSRADKFHYPDLRFEPPRVKRTLMVFKVGMIMRADARLLERSYVGALPEPSRVAENGASYRFGPWATAQKAVFDYCGALGLIILTSPLLCLVLLAIKLDSSGSILFRQRRTGRDNKPFNCFKFRTMYADQADDEARSQTMRDDPRVTRIGRWLRRFSIDELPQLFNVLRGEMSLVGPRPHGVGTTAENRPLADLVDGYDLRHRVKPGITGWAQVNGCRGPVHTLDDVRHRVEYDLQYIESWTLIADIQILIKTARYEIFSSRAY
jgi:exopolysaccharide biosynthesis polyprenyl glycosylphosphotransferase